MINLRKHRIRPPREVKAIEGIFLVYSNGDIKQKLPSGQIINVPKE